MPRPTEPVRVLITVPTYRRVSLLPPLVAEIKAQVAMLPAGFKASIALVDNDPNRSAEPIARELGVGYAWEPTPGIAAVRQAAVRLAKGVGVVVMLDDDTTPEEGWLVALVNAWVQYSPTVVMGYVRYVWPAGFDAWIAAGGFLRRNHHSTGTRLSELSTGNVLVDAAAVAALGDVEFDAGLGLSGGEDTDFGRKVIAAGGAIVASGESIVRDQVDPSRVNREFVKRRTIAHGQTRALTEIGASSAASRRVAQVRQWLGGGIRLGLFSGWSLLGKLSGNLRWDAVGQRRAWFARGRMRGAVGSRGREYARESPD